MKEDEVFVDFEIRKEDDEENLCAYCLHGLCADVCKECLGLNWK